MLDIRFTEAAEADLSEARDWYETESPDLSRRFLIEVRKQLDRIAENHQQFPLLRRGARRAHVRNFPYGIIFRVVDDIIYIVAIFHFSRNPRIWQKRV
jgi:plasmid stabilization system protein ParE